jgi:hypothetical protein
MTAPNDPRKPETTEESGLDRAFADLEARAASYVPEPAAAVAVVEAPAGRQREIPWATVAAAALDAMPGARPLPRYRGARAEEAWLRARLAEHVGGGDGEGERQTSMALARLLVSRGTELDAAATLARRALTLHDDPTLRTELAGWLAGIGQPALGAMTLRGLLEGASPSARATTLVRLAVLLARAGDATGAADSLREAARLAPKDAIAQELFGTLAAWAPTEVAPSVAAAAYLDAANRREAAGDSGAGFEDLLRAFEASPAHEAASDALARALAARGRPGAADEVERLHGNALWSRDAGRARRVHVRRMVAAHRRGDHPRALGALLDATLDGEVGAAPDPTVIEVLASAGLYELLAARYELYALRQRGAARAQAFADMARLYAGPLADEDRAVEAWIESACAHDPSSLEALREHAKKDERPLVEALMRIGAEVADPATPARVRKVSALRELLGIAMAKETRAPSLARWALTTLRELGSSDVALESELAEVGPGARAEDAELAATKRRLSSAGSPTEKARLLETIARLESARPDDRDGLAETLATLARTLPDRDEPVAALARVTRRGASTTRLEAVLRARVEHASARSTRVRGRIGLALLAWGEGREADALAEIRPLLTEAPGNRFAAALLLALACRLGRSKERADALVELARSAPAGLAAVLLACAAELTLAASASHASAASALAAEACEADPTCERAAVALAAVEASAKDRASAVALEQAMGIVVPRGPFCRALADTLESLGELELALGWTQRWLALSPGSPSAVAELIRRATLARSANRVHDALAWVLAQAAPLGELALPFASALELLRELDPSRALAVARRALDVFGPAEPVLRERLLHLADAAKDRALAVALLERWAASGASADVTVPVLFEVARRRSEAGTFDAAARALARAAELGAPARELLPHADELEKAAGSAGLGSDGLVALAEARATSLSALLPAEAQRAALAWRTLANLRWDLAGDRSGAEYALFVAAQTLPRGGVEIYARDLRELAGAEDAHTAMLARASSLEEPGEQRIRSAVLIQAAALAASSGHELAALEAARQAIALDPSRADAVGIIERCSRVDGGLEILDETYDFLAEAALGRYGRRAAHYRAARELDRRGAVDRALVHAVACFEAVPSEGTSYVLLAELAEKAGERGQAVRAIERVAMTVEGDPRAAWLRRAASLAGEDEEGVRTRFDILLRAFHVRPDAAMAAEAARATARFVEVTGDAELANLRFERVLRATLSKLDGPDGARAAVAMAEAALDAVSAPSVAIAALLRGLAVDGDLEEYERLTPRAALIAADPGGAADLVRTVRDSAKKPFASVGPALLRLTAAVAKALGDDESAAALLVEAARRAPEDAALVHRASEAAEAVGQPELARQIDDALPVARRVEALLHLADRHERDGEEKQAGEAYERALATGELTEEEQSFALERALDIYRSKGHKPELEALLRTTLARLEPSAPESIDYARELAQLLTARGDAEGALAVLAPLSERSPSLWGEVRELSRKAGDKRGEVAALTRLLDAAQEPGERAAFLRELAPLEEALGDAAAYTHYEAILRLEPGDVAALASLERAADERRDHAAIAALLAHRIDVEPEGDTRRVLRLRRAAVLEQRLGRLEEAVQELELLLAEAPEDGPAVRFLADLHERLGAPLRAGPLWLRASELSPTIDDRAEYGLRACRCFLQGGDVAAARTTLDDVAPMASREAVIETRVELARRSGDARALSDALDQLASTGYHTPERRAELLLEAARAAASVDDESTALERARRASKMAPDHAEAVLEARRLLYRMGGAGAPREAQEAIEELTRIEPKLSPDDVELQSFLLAEELDVIQGGGAGMRELAKRHAELGPRPLIALGMAERLAKSRNFAEARPLFEDALKGSLRGLRSRGRVALAAADAAQQTGALEVAARLLEEAAAEPDTRPIAQRRRLELTALRGSPASARRALEELLHSASGLDRARLLGQLARLQAASDRNTAVRLYGEALRAATSDRALHAELADELSRLQGVPADAADSGPSQPTRTPSGRPAMRSSPPQKDDAHGPGSGPHAQRSLLPVLVSEVLGPDRGPVVVRVTEDDFEGPASFRPSVQGRSEEALVADLGAGSYEAGEALIQLYGGNPGARSRDVLAVRKRQAALRPGDPATLEKLHRAAEDEHATALARAVEHVMSAFSERHTTPPPLSEQHEAEDLVASLVFRPVSAPVHEALGLVWETGLFRKEMSHYGLTGVDRVQPGAATVVADVYRNASRVLGLGRTALYYQRAAGPLSAKVVLLAQPAVAITGETTEDTPELRFTMGAALAGAMPSHALINALPEAQVQKLLATLNAAFGPVGMLPRGDTETANRVRELWQAVTPRAERRLREIFAEPEGTDYETARTGTRQAMWRAGLFAAGDLTVALRLVLVELAVPVETPLSAAGGLAKACAAYSPVADLVRLATRMEYAEARWQAPKAAL